MLVALAVLSIFLGVNGAEVMLITFGDATAAELSKGIIARGHNVRLITPKLTKDGVLDWREVASLDVASSGRIDDPRHSYCQALFSAPVMEGYLKKETALDIVIAESKIAACAAALANHLEVPFVLLNTDLQISTGFPKPFYLNNVYSPLKPNDVTFTSRLKSFQHDKREISNKDFKEISSTLHLDVKDSIANVSFVLQNNNLAIANRGTYFANIANIGGVHCRPGKPLPEDLKAFLSEGDKTSFIYLNLVNVLSDKDQRDLFRIMEDLPYKVLWKWNGGQVQNLPRNVLLRKSLPQQDLLAHSNIKLFVNNGDMESLLETVYHGVPAIIVSKSQKIFDAAEIGNFAITMDTLNPKAFRIAMRDMMLKPNYKKNVQKLQAIFVDNLHSPSDTAAFWTEYVIRHKNHSHLKMKIERMWGYQYYSIDVILVLIVAAILFWFVLKRALILLFMLYKFLLSQFRRINDTSTFYFS